MHLTVSCYRFFAIGLFLFYSIVLFSQSDCGCDQCQIPIIADQTRTFSLDVSGAQSNELGQFGQGVCEVEIDFAHDFISDLEISLTSPAGVTVPLINPLSNNDTTYFSRWKIKIKPCGDPVTPDAGFLPIFKNNTNWPNNTTFTGSYNSNFTPGNECLEHLNTGPVNGKWLLNVSSSGYRGVGFIYGFKIKFCDPLGIACSGLNYEVIAGESCDTAAPLPTDINEFVGNTAGFGPSMSNFYCGSIENDQWFTFISNCTMLGFSITPGYCIDGAGLQFALYEACGSPIPIACEGGCQTCGWQTQSIVAQVVPGHQYYLLIDGWAGDQCDFVFDVPPSCIGDLGDPDPNDFNLNGCKGSTQTVGLTEIPFGAAGYIWKANNGALVNGQTQVTVPGPENTSVEVTFGNGLSDLCVAAYNFTDTTSFVCFPITADTNLFLVENASVCYTDLPFYSQYFDFGVPPLSFPGLHQYYLHNYIDKDGQEYPCPVLVTVNLSVEGSFSPLPPVMGLGSEYTLPNGQVVDSSDVYFWSDTLASGCTNDHLQSIYLIDYFINSDGCAPDTVTFILPTNVYLSCPGGFPSIVATEGANLVVYQNSGVYDVVGHIGNQTFLFEDTIKLNLIPSPHASFTASVTQNMVTLNNYAQNATGLLWDFGDGSTSTEPNPTHTYAAPGTYTITQMAFGTCPTSTYTNTITIGGQLPQAAFQISEAAGCAPLLVQFSDQSIGNPTAWAWEFPGGDPAISTAENPMVTYNSPGTYSATLTIQNVFGQNTSVQNAVLTVSTPTIANFTANATLNVVSLDNLSQNATGYLWDFGDGTTSTDAAPLHAYNAPGAYNITLLATGLCDSSTHSIIVNITGSAPEAGFQAFQNIGCVPLIVQFQDLSSDNPNAWLWQFPGGIPNTSTEQNPSIIYTVPGTYDATLTAQNAFGESTLAQTAIVSASPLPTVLYTMMPNGLEVVFANQSQNAASYLWDFGDGIASTEANPTHTYANPGEYLVTLQAINTCGTSILQLWVTVLASGTSQPLAFAWLNISPNPSDGYFQLEMRDAPSPKLSWRLFNALGQSIAERDLGAFGGNYAEKLDFRQLPPAVYWLEVQTAEKRAWVKLVIE